MRRMVFGFLIGVFLLGSVGVSWAAGQGEESDDGVYEIAYVARAQSDEFASWLADAIEEEVDEYDDLEVTVFDGESDNAVIAEHIENAIVRQFDLILLQPLDSEAQVAPLREAIDAGVDVATVNNVVNDENIPGVDADPEMQAAENAKLAVEQVPEDGEVVILMGPAGNMHSDRRRDGWQEYFLDERSDVEILDEQIANWNKGEALDITEDWVSTYGEDIDAVISMNDHMAAGAIEAMVEAWGEDADLPYVYGVDGTAEATLMIEEGWFTSTTLQNAYELAEKSIALSHDILTGEYDVDYSDESRFEVIDNPLYTQDNVDELREIHERAGLLDPDE